MGKIIFITLILFCYVNARPFKSPDFISQWFYIGTIPGRERIDVNHYLGEVPALVQVQVRSDSNNNPGFIFPAIGIVPRDDDTDEPRSGIVYVYNDKMVSISAQSENNNVRGRAIYTENSDFWEGPNNDESFDCFVRVRAWKMSSMPTPDFHVERIEIRAFCKNGPDCFYEQYHGLKEYPSMVIVRTKLLDIRSEFHGFMSDAVGSGMMVYENVYIGGKQNGYVTYGFDTDNFRIWTDSSDIGYVFCGQDATGFGAIFRSGELEILAWRSSTLTPSIEEIMQLGTLPGESFDNNKKVQASSPTEDLIVTLWAEATNGSNDGYRFIGSGALAYSKFQTSVPCSYGGLTYAYTNSTIRIWKPGAANIGNVICIPRTFGGGMHTQGTNLAVAKAHIWIPRVSTLNMNCSKADDCFDMHSICNNMTCICKAGYYETDSACEKNLTCTDKVPIIPDLERRARNNIFDNRSHSDTYVDDSALKLSWYAARSLSKEYKMPDVSTVPAGNSCGTKYPVFVNGTHPALDVIEETPQQLDVCYDNCKQTGTILVRNCNGLLHYQLKQIPVKENAYCFDPPELQNVVEFEPVPEVADFNLNVHVELQFEITKVLVNGKNVNNYNPYLTFNCSVDKKLPDQLYYTTYWFIESKLFVALGPSSVVLNLTEHMLNDRNQKLNVYISCGIKLSKTVTGLMTDLVKSDEKFYGIKVKNPVIHLRKGEDSYVLLEPTAPIGCKYSDENGVPTSCKRSLYLAHPQSEGCDLTEIIIVNKIRTCGSQFKAFTANETWIGGEIYEFQITTVDKNFADGHQFRLPFQFDNYFHNIWQNLKIDDVMVFVTHNDEYKFKQCYSHVDPHMQTADGYKYENQYEGEFVLYRNFKYGIEVQEKTTSCNNGRAFCACAVAVRAGGDIFLINTCGGLKFIGFTSCSDGGILDVRKRSSLRYQVFTPIGTYIDIQMRPHPNYYNLMNIDVYMAAKDMEQTEGLCGFFDNNPANDLLKRNRHDYFQTKNDRRNYHKGFSDEWRLKNFEQNYLVLQPEPVQTWQTEQRDMFCYCNVSLGENENIEESTDKESAGVCSASIYGNCSQSKRTITVELCKRFNQRFRRSVNELKEVRELKRRQQLINKIAENLSKREDITREKITEEDAEKHCSNVILSQPSVQKFGHRLKSVDPQQLINECTYDISEGNDLSWADVYPSVLNHVIEANNGRDPEYVEGNKEEVAEFITQSCPSNCNGQGICSDEGECICKHGYHGPDCGIEEDKLIKIDDIEGGGVCDITSGEECACFHIQTINLLENFHCQVSEISVMINGSHVLSNTTQSLGKYDDIFNGECCVSQSKKQSDNVDDIFSTEFEFSISNNGKYFGSSTRVYILDSTCQELIEGENGMFIALKEQTCFISGVCRTQNETRFGDECSACLSQHNRFDWTKTCGAPHISPEHNIHFVLGLCGGFLVAIVFIISMFCVWKKCKGKHKISVTEYIIYRTEPPNEMSHKYPRPNLSIFTAKKSEEN